MTNSQSGKQKTFKRKLAEWAAKFYVRYGRGNSLINVARDAMLLMAASAILLEFFGIENINKLSLFGVVIVAIGGMYVLGLLDEKYGFWKIEMRYATEEINPFFKEMMELLKEIKKRQDSERFKYKPLFGST